VTAVRKVELHCHLLGVISPALLARQHQPLVEPEALRAAMAVHDLASFQHWVEVLKPYHSAPAALMRPILAAHIENLKAQNVVYTEIMISPAMFNEELTDFAQWREEVLELEAGRIQVEFLMTIPRTLAPELLERDRANFVRLAKAGLIAGVALVGAEHAAQEESLVRFQNAFQVLHDAGLGIEVHAGEHAGPESVRDALRYAHPQRLGHGLAAFRDPELIEQICSQGIHLEFCPSSNLHTGALNDIAQHPIAQARKLEISFSINTDDPGLFSCSMNSEFQLLADSHQFTPTDFDDVFHNSLRARFAPKLRYQT
jgi:adenosine deaminase